MEAGADAILIHSKDKTLAEIEGFHGTWSESRPFRSWLSTLYPTFTDELGKEGFQLVIFANHPMRAAVQAIEQTLDTLARERNAAAVDPDVAPSTTSLNSSRLRRRSSSKSPDA